MSDTNQNLWCIRAGKNSEADHLFLQRKFVALQYAELPDLAQFPDDREPFKTLLQTIYPAMKRGAVPTKAGQIYRFIHEMKIGDWVIYPSKLERMFHFGQVTAGYEFAPGRNRAFPHQRAVTWRYHLSRNAFSQGALYEINSALTFFVVKNYADEFWAVINGETPSVPVSEDDSVRAVSSDIEEITRDFVLKTLARHQKGHALEDFIAHLLQVMGFFVRKTGRGADGGIDLIAHRDELGFEPPIIKVQVKSGEGNISRETLSTFVGNLDKDRDHGLFITLGDFTAPAKRYDADKTHLRILGGEQLVDLILHHYDKLDMAYKRLLPLKQVFIPQPLPDGEDQGDTN